MKIMLLIVGKTSNKHIQTLVNEYLERLKHYKIGIDIHVISDIKNSNKLSALEQKKAEGAKILRIIDKHDFIVLLDEHGVEHTSVQLAKWIENKMNSSIKRIVFIIGGAYGFSSEIYNYKDEMISLSKLTFSHQMVRLIFIEQLYRAMTILNNEPYHHE